jgi:hypothetical protein
MLVTWRYAVGIEQLFWIVAAVCLIILVQRAVQHREPAAPRGMVPWYAAGNWLGWLALGCFFVTAALRAQGPWAMAALTLGMLALIGEVGVTLRARRSCG